MNFGMEWMRRAGRLSLMAGVCMAASMWVSGCGLLADPSQTQHVSAQYTGLANKSVAIVVYTENAIANEFPAARQSVSAFVASQLGIHAHIKWLVPYMMVINWQDDTLNWFGLPEKDIGKHFSVDRVVYIELLEFEAHGKHGYGDMQGHVRAKCKVYETDTPGMEPAWSGVLDVLWPQDRPLDSTQTNENTVLRRVLEIFSEDLVDYFYDHDSHNRPMSERH